ncbi:UNVERIFIED_CONTAM: hypothetical protein Sradi_2379700 [Sesamum radiatum]|uniref:Uncharacterized protein n=1 Tax=Sesamum radiatum TaxID=300843 RepID=A0AAW2T6L0_SESRA
MARWSRVADADLVICLLDEVAGGLQVEVAGLATNDSRGRLIAWSQQAAVRSELARPGDWRPQQVVVQGRQRARRVTCILRPATCDLRCTKQLGYPLFLKICFCIYFLKKFCSFKFQLKLNFF